MRIVYVTTYTCDRVCDRVCENIYMQVHIRLCIYACVQLTNWALSGDDQSYTNVPHEYDINIQDILVSNTCVYLNCVAGHE